MTNAALPAMIPLEFLFPANSPFAFGDDARSFLFKARKILAAPAPTSVIAGALMEREFFRALASLKQMSYQAPPDKYALLHGLASEMEGLIRNFMHTHAVDRPRLNALAEAVAPLAS
jgi:hypothetical protein